MSSDNFFAFAECALINRNINLFIILGWFGNNSAGLCLISVNIHVKGIFNSRIRRKYLGAFQVILKVQPEFITVVIRGYLTYIKDVCNLGAAACLNGVTGCSNSAGLVIDIVGGKFP